MKPREIASLLRFRRPPAPHGARTLARTYSIDDIARVARRRLPRSVMGYLDGGGEGEVTLRRNRAAFDEIEIVPSALRDVSDVDTSATVLGARLPVPLILGPVGAPGLLHPEGELAVARAARGAGLPYAISTLATTSIERIARETDGVLWFQLYLWGDRTVAEDLIERARALQYRALLVNLDVTVRSKRERELAAGLSLPRPELGLSTLLDGALHPAWSWRFLTSSAPSFPNVGDAAHVAPTRSELERMFDGTINWRDLEWIARAWDGPLAVKGILSPAAARRAADLGVDAVIVSNHGGRQLDHVPATIDVLAPIVDEVGDRVEVLFDSGVRRGTDVLVALALGARGVLVGRAYLYGLAAAGAPGVAHALDILTSELRTAMALTGAASVGDLHRGLVRRRTRDDIGK